MELAIEYRNRTTKVLKGVRWVSNSGYTLHICLSNKEWIKVDTRDIEHYSINCIDLEWRAKE